MTRAAIWLLGVVLLGCVLAALAATGRLQISSDLQALLPAPHRDPVQSAALERIGDLGQRRLVVLVAADNEADAPRAIDAAAQQLTASGAFDKIVTRTQDLLSSAERKALDALYADHRFHLLAPADAAALEQLSQGDEDERDTAHAYFLDRARAQLYGLGVGPGAAFVDDPLGLERAYRDASTRNPAPGLKISADGHFYVQDDNDRRYVALFAQSRKDPFSMTAQADQLDALAQARQAIMKTAPDADVLMSGVVRHAAAASQRARTEVTFIGAGSLLGIVLLMYAAFGSLRPVALSVAVIAGGVLLAMVVTALVFDSVHILTLVFGASLVGVAVDYCLHFFAQRLHTPAPHAALKHILPAVTLGLVTSVLAYGGMAVAPFPGLRQIALFVATGLIGAWVGVILLLPATAGPAPRAGRAFALAHAWLRYGPARLTRHLPRYLAGVLGLVFLLLLSIAVTMLTPDDDIRLLYDPPANLLHDDMQVARLLGTPIGSQGIVVRGGSPAEVLARESSLRVALNASQPPIAQTNAITQAYPPPALQRRQYAQLGDTLYARDGPVAELLGEAGFAPSQVDSALQAFTARKGSVLTFDQWQASPASTGLRDLWLGRTGSEWASLIRIRQVNDEDTLTRAVHAQPGAQRIDRVADISGLIGRYRQLATWLLAGAYGLAWLLLAWRFGARGALTLLLAPALASVLVAVVFAATGWPFSLFNLLALILLLGLGADYGIFLRMADTDQASAMLAVGLSVATTLLAFGLLALSHTPALHGFGLTLTLGLMLTFVLASFSGGAPAADNGVTGVSTREEN